MPLDPEEIANNIEDDDLNRPEPGSFIGSVIVLHNYGDDTYADVLPSQPGISLRNNFSQINLPNGDIVILAKTVHDLKINTKLDEKDLEALFNAGLIDSDDETGEFII